MHATSLRGSGLYHSLKQKTPEGHWDTIVVGSGIAGMACAAALTKGGQRVLLLEQHTVPGGMTHCFTRDGFRWDVGVHCVGEQGPKDVAGKLLAWLTDGELKMNRLPETYERFWFPDQCQLTYSSDTTHFRQQLKATFPDEREALDRYFKLVDLVFNVARPFYALKATPLGFNKFVTRLMGWMWQRFWNRRTREVFDELFKDERLKALLGAQWGYHGSPPSRSSFGMHAMVARHFYDGAYYPVGGSESFARTLLKTIQEGGSETYVLASVKNVVVEHGRAIGVDLEGGQRILADRVVSNAGVKSTINCLMPATYRETPWAKRLNALPMSPPYMCLNLGFEGDLRAAGASETNNWLMESWNIDDAYWDISDPNSVPPIAYVSFPSMKDPEIEQTTPQRHTGEVLTFVHWEHFQNWENTEWKRRGESYESFKASLEARLIAHLKRRLPAIMKHLVFHELSTPLSTVHFTRSWKGGIYGYETTPERFASTDLTAHTPVKNLFLTGADVVTPGVAGALVSGVLTASAIRPSVFLKLL